MPIFAVNLSEKLFTSVRELIDRGMYQSLERFLEVAAYNQLALERGMTPEQLITRDPRQPQDEALRLTEDARKAASPEGAKRSRQQKKQRRKKGHRPAANKKETGTAESGVEISADVVLDRWVAPKMNGELEPAKAMGIAVGEHLWGQVNRLFPVKLACRWIAKAAANGKWPPYFSVADDLADEAAAVGQVLGQWDTAAGRKRDEVLSTGLPRRGNSASRDRFISQYLARVTRGGDVQPGAICLYGLAACRADEVVLTAEGVKFALLQNPILDRRDTASASTLEEEEFTFLCRQVRDHALGEYEDMKAILTAVRDGKATPSALAEAVRGAFPTDWSDVVYRTHLSGLIARLADLRLLRRSWEGRNVQYGAGAADLVESFLK